MQGTVLLFHQFVIFALSQQKHAEQSLVRHRHDMNIRTWNEYWMCVCLFISQSSIFLSVSLLHTHTHTLSLSLFSQKPCLRLLENRSLGKTLSNMKYLSSQWPWQECWVNFLLPHTWKNDICYLLLDLFTHAGNLKQACLREQFSKYRFLYVPSLRQERVKNTFISVGEAALSTSEPWISWMKNEFSQKAKNWL